MNKGDIWLVEFPYLIGKEQTGKRPAIVLADTKTTLTIIIPLTSNFETLKYPHTLKIKPSKTNKLDKDSAALIFQIRAIDKRRLLHKIGDLESNYLDMIDVSLKEMFKLK